MTDSADTRSELVQLINEIKATAGCRTDLDGLLNRLESKTGDADIGMLIFCPPDGKDLTAEEILQISLKRVARKST